MKSPTVHICTFQAVDTPTRKTRYEDFRAAVLAAGRFSVFEATANQTSASMFDRLCRDPAVVTNTVGFPWTEVRAALAGTDTSGEGR